MTNLAKTQVVRVANLSLDNRQPSPIVVTLDGTGALPRITFRPKGTRKTYSMLLSTAYTRAVTDEARRKVANKEPRRRRQSFSRGLLAVSRQR